MDDFQRPLDLLNLVQAKECAANATVQADDLLVDDRGQRQPIEQVVDFVEDGVDVGGLLTQTAATLLRETEGIVDPFVLVITPQEVDLIRELDLESHQETDSFKRVGTTVDVIAKEEVIITLDIAIVVWNTPEVKESH